MAFKIIWSEKANNDLINILEYWKERNLTNAFSIKLNEIIHKRIELIAQYPKLGKRTRIKDVRVHVVKDYLLFYRIVNKSIYILSVFDGRQDPNKLKKLRK